MKAQAFPYLVETPSPSPAAGRRALKAFLSGDGVFAALEALHSEMGDVFRIPLPGFSPVVLVGPEANRFVAVTGREDLLWRAEQDPVTRLLHEGLLVTDGELHDELRRQISPALHKQALYSYVESMQRQTDRVTQSWQDGEQRDMLVEMREIALLILFDTLFGVDFQDDLRRLWPDILKTLQFISPGPWLVFPGLPRPGYHRALRRMDQYLHELIDGRRRRSSASPDLLSSLLDSGMPAGRIRDQLLTLLIAGHDTSTALLAWTLFLLGSHPADMARLSAEVDLVLGKQNEPASVEQIEGLRFLDQVIQESLRLYPPVHLGSRIAARDLVFQGYRIPAGTRVMYSIYLTHRMGRYWPEPQRFLPERFTPENNRKRPHYTYLPFGGGSRNCIGLGFARLEVKIVLARLLQTFDLNLLDDQVYAHMGATLEPRPGVWMSAFRR